MLSNIWDSVHRIDRAIDLTVYVDDTGLEARGNFKHILHCLPAATAAVVEGLRGLEMELSGTKKVVFASAPALPVKVAAA
ncbi:MAG: hypothetical protein ACKPKO_48805, partial [Candidatus Fonsibacter sp.]